MAIDFEVRIADAFVQSDFATPAFDLMRSDLPTIAYAGLAPQGLRLADMKVELGRPNIASNSLECTLFDFTMAVRFKLDRFEVQAFDCMRVKLPTVLKIAAETRRIVQASSPTVSFKSTSCTLALHGLLSGTTGHEFVRQYVTKIPPIGPLVAAGATFLFGSENDLRSFLSIEPSSSVSLGLFLKLIVVLTGAGTEPDSFASMAEERLRGTLTQLGFVVHGL